MDVRAVAAALRQAAPDRAGLALRAGLCVGVPLTIGLLLGHPADGAAASFGGMAGMSASQAPYRYRVRVVAGMGVGMVLAVLAGALAAGTGPLVVVVVGLVAGLASFGCQAAELPPPRELMLVMATLTASGQGSGPADALHRAGLAAAGAVLAWLICMSPALLGRRRAPERRAVDAAIAALADLLAAIGSASEGPARYAAVGAVRRARNTVAQGALPAEDPLVRTAVAAEAVLDAALHVAFEATGPVDPGWARAVRALRSPSAGPELPPDRSMVGAEPLASAITEARDARAGSGPAPAPGPELRPWPSFGRQLGAALQRQSVVGPAAARIGVAVAVGVGIGQLLGLSHAYWVGLTVAAVLQGSNLTVTRRRVGHRVAGTAIGVALAFVLLGWGPPLWLTVLAAALFQAAIELVVSTHYGLAVVGITVLALLLFHLGAPQEQIGAALGARLLDTAIGAATALVLRLLLWPRATSARLPQVQARAVRAVRRVLAAAWTAARTPGRPRSAELVQESRRLQGELVALRAVHADALADGGPPGAAAQWPISEAVEQLAMLALSRPGWRGPPDPEPAGAFLDRLDGLASAVGDGGDPGPDPAALPGYPRTSAAAVALASATRNAHADRGR